MSETYLPTPRTALKAADLWAQMLRKPIFENKDNSFQGTLARVLATQIGGNATEELLDAFRAKLAERIMHAEPGYYPCGYLSVDYSPCAELLECANAVGLKVSFPWKTDMTISRDFVRVSVGYAAEPVYYHALPEGKWLVTTLSGSDIEKIKKYVIDGTLPLFEVVQDPCETKPKGESSEPPQS